MFDQLIGNSSIKQVLSRMLTTQKIDSSLLFSGPDGVGKSLFALAFAKALLGKESPADLYIQRPEGKVGMHSLQSLRKLCEEVTMAPFEGKWKVFIIYEADRMLNTSANALLKTLEEPSPHSVIILLSSSPDSLLPTIRSRCRLFSFQGLPQEEMGSYIQKTFNTSPSQAQAIASLAEGSLGQARFYLEKGAETLRKKILQLFCKGRLSSYTELMQAARECEKIIDQSLPEEDAEAALHHALHFKALLTIISSWFRDLQLLYLHKSSELLINCDFIEELTQAIQRGEILSLDRVEKSLTEARRSFERSTPIYMCLEKVLLDLQFQG